jgi:hypothetical protein
LFEIQDIPSVVTGYQENSTTVISCFTNIENILGGWGGKNITDNCPISKPTTNNTIEGWVVSRSSPNNNRDL